MCIWEWKRDIFLTKNPGLEEQFNELSQHSVRQRIQRGLELEGIVPNDPEDKYGYYIERCFPVPENRRRYFQELVRDVQPGLGYKMLCLLAEANIVQSVWTTNFDQLVPQAMAGMDLSTSVIEVGLDTTDRIERAPSRDELVHVALHGDYRYDRLKNTDEEIRKQDERLRQHLIDQLSDHNLIVVGYSGRDRSVMTALREAYSEPGTGTLYWCGYGEERPSEHVADLIRHARSKNRKAFYTPTSGFRDLLDRLARHCLKDDLAQKARQHREKNQPREARTWSNFEIQVEEPSSLIKSNAFPVECPSEVLQFEWDPAQEGSWELLRERVAEYDVVAGLHRGKALALGTVDGVKDAFRDEIASSIDRAPIHASDLGRKNGVITNLLQRALVRTIAQTCSLNSDGKRLVWTNEYSTRRIYGTKCRVHDAARLSIRRYKAQQYLVVKPTIVGRGDDGNRLPDDVNRQLRFKELSQQYNDKFNKALNEWRGRLNLRSGQVFEYPVESGSTFRFNVEASPRFAQIADPNSRDTIEIPESARHLVDAEGIKLQEPRLVFSSKSGNDYVEDINPIRGLVNNQPYDYQLGSGELGSRVKLGVVCPSQDSQLLERFLRKFRRRQETTVKKQYLVDYPGFESAFGTGIDIPNSSSEAWVDCPEPKGRKSVDEEATNLARFITQRIDSLMSSTACNVILIFIPNRWKQYESYQSDGVRFDLHDFVKAYCVNRGVSSQLIRGKTVSDSYQPGQIIWSLALAFYVKTLRTPWTLDLMDPRTAYVGLGFSIDHAAAEDGKHIVLGCSHIYNHEGVGIGYRLSKLEEPVSRRRDAPFMSRADAQRMAENTVQLFYESRMQLPRRVVVHKQVPFPKEECEGLLEGFTEVDSVDLIEITEEPHLRYMASKVENGRFKGDGYPVRRGTVIALDNRRALVWVHGTTEPLKAGLKYFQGGRRIPAPLMMKRHHGDSNLTQLADEILGLSKMNWNNLDLYTKMPTTLDSSRNIARIGDLLGNVNPRSYDYRLFI
jgi:hypothetical protein